MLDFHSALLTGASSGIGAAVVGRLRALGLHVLALARRHDRLHQLADETGAVPLVMDLLDVEAIYRELSGRRIDVLVNNAGVGRGFFSALTASREDIEQTLRTNVEAPLHVVRAVVPGMVRRGHGHVLHIGSIAGLYPLRSAIYGASKAAVHLFAQNLRTELVGTGVRSTEIAPGRVETEFFAAALDSAEDRTRLGNDFQALSAEDVAAAVEYAIRAPRHVNVSFLEILPADQAVGCVGTGPARRRAGPAEAHADGDA